MSAPLEEQQNTPMQQPEITNKNSMDPTTAEKDATELKRKLEAFQNFTNMKGQARHEQINTNSAGSVRNQGQAGQQNSLEVTHERIQEGQDNPTFTGPKPMQQDEEEIMDKAGSKREKSGPMIRAMSIDHFLKENGIDVKNILDTLGVNDDVPFTVPILDGRDSSALDADYYQHVMTDIDDDKGNILDLNLLIQTKFILPMCCGKCVMQTARDSWKWFKRKINRKHFVPYDDIEDMVKN
ncbi:hypothetical protein PIB30_084548 [Stylosanthes scabra]|uniref:Uncharacterized protein n=1 Tax=Stylosanthes scabra TaxID=79078 RepID=A0ABU6RSV9_9FABA|nr:hypothetical protein [Stylosanthes scabra]